MLGEGSSAAARLNEQEAGTATWVHGFPEQQSQLSEKVEVQFYSEKKCPRSFGSSKPGEVEVVLPGSSQCGLWVNLSPPIIRLREEHRCTHQAGDQLPLGLTNTAQPAWEGSSRADRHRLVTAVQGMWGCSWDKRPFAK